MITYQDIKSGAVPAPVANPTDTKAVVTQTITGKLPGMIRAAADKLAAATSAAEVLDARDEARLTYSTAQVAGRIAKAKGAHDKVVAAAHRAQADALEIEAEAKRRLADEYDGAQQRGEVATKGKPVNVPDQNIKATVGEIGLTRKDVHDARRVRNAEQAQSGVVKAALEQAIAEGREPSRAVVNEAIAEALGETKPVSNRSDAESEARSIQWAWDQASEQGRALFLDRNDLTESNQATGMGGGDVDRSATRASSAVEVGATNSPDGADETGRFESGSLTEILVKPQVQVLPGTPIQGAKGGPTGMGRSDGVERHAPNSNPQPKTPVDADKAEAVPPPSVSAGPFKTLSQAYRIKALRPNCLRPELCAGSGRQHCYSCRKAAGDEGEAA